MSGNNTQNAQKTNVDKLQKRLEMIRDLASTLSNPAVARAELSAIMSDPSSYSAAILNVHLHQTLNEIVTILNRKALERLEAAGQRTQIRSPAPVHAP